MARARQEIGIRWKGNRRQAFVRINGKFHSQTFPADTDVSVLRAWRDAEVARHAVIGPAAGSLGADIAAYCRKPEIAAMPSIRARAAHLELWAAALGRDQSRHSVTRDEVEAVIQRWLASGLATATVYHRRTAFGSFYVTMNGASGARNPVTGTTRPAHYRPVNRSVPITTLERILATMPADRYVKKGIRQPSFARLRVACILYTGIPPAELQKLRASYFDRVAKTMRMPWRDKGAGTPARDLELSDEAVAAFIALDAAGAWGSFPVEALGHSFKRAARAICGPDTAIRLYDLRHSFAAEAYRVTHDITCVGRLLGHVEGSIVTARYAMGAHADVDRAALAKLSAFRQATREAARLENVLKLPAKVASVRNSRQQQHLRRV
jgi:integrase